MAKVTRIKASDGPRESEKANGHIDEPPITRDKVVVKDKKSEKAKAKAAKVAEREARRKEREESGKKTFILFRPFVALGRYLRDSWKEIRQVRWPTRKATWKMVLAVLVYTAIFMIFISLLDLFFRWFFSLIIK
ncbi:preprotein translocase subunit SecE [Candidatus Saccharibacteria bacterium]|nr:preprotein translocase subunit SecE [Candidatus Saccharibacteria bacterium]